MAGEPRATLSAAWTPATAVITREVVPGREPDYQQWSRRLLTAGCPEALPHDGPY
jgi:hypothetical protein